MVHPIRLIFILGFVFFSLTLNGAYEIKGQINMKGEWQSQIFLATIDKLGNYYRADAEYIVNSTSIDEDGNFVMKGDNLPAYDQFYRLYLIKEAHSEFNACLFVGGDEHNFIHLLLNNDSQLELNAAMDSYAPFGDYQLSGDHGNELMKSISEIVYPSYHFYEIKFPSELQFTENKLNQDLFNFADSCTNALVALAAINNTDYEMYYDTHQAQYEKMSERMLSWKYLSFLFLGISLALMYWVYKLKTNQTSLTEHISTPKVDYQFTPQEEKILSLISAGKSNKEIASELFIELSTVKSHINKLYAKMKVSSRGEAIHLAKSLKV